MYGVLAVVATCVVFSSAYLKPPECGVRARTEGGWVCGIARERDGGQLYASFRGVPYAQQPLGELRFKELQPVQQWTGYRDARHEGPVCPQQDVLYGPLMRPQAMAEACIHANVHVPLASLPGYNDTSEDNYSSLDLEPPRQAAFEAGAPVAGSEGLPIVVFIHGGGFAFGSGDADFYGPEYLVSKGVVVITFNYRLNVMGFLSLNSTSIPGNNGLRDMVTLLRWVQTNARAFGGDPRNVTLAGQSAGASSAHLLSLSPAAEGLFHRLWLMSGVALPIFFTTSPAYSQFAAATFLTIMNITATDPEDIHQQLVEAPLEKIVEANSYMLEQFGLTTFMPVVESYHRGVTPILEEDPAVLIRKGCGNTIPTVVGFTSVECETFRPRFEKIDMISRITDNPLLVVSPHLLYTTTPAILPGLANEIQEKYFNGSANLDSFVNLCTDQYFKYPALRLASLRAETGGAPMYLYEFAYNDNNSVLKEAFEISYSGAAHMEDMTYVLRANSILAGEEPQQSDNDAMRDWMSTLFANFMKNSSTAPIAGWAPINEHFTHYQEIRRPNEVYTNALTEKLHDLKGFFDSIFQKVAK